MNTGHEKLKTYKNFLNASRDGKSALIFLPEKMFADFLIKINYHSIPFRRFFFFIVDAYLKDDKRIMDLLEDSVSNYRPAEQNKFINRDKISVKKTETVFGLNEKEIEDIYDILEEEVEDFR